MADTVRTVAALQTLFANNTSGDISAQDIRDFLVTVGNRSEQSNADVAAAGTSQGGAAAVLFGTTKVTGADASKGVILPVNTGLTIPYQTVTVINWANSVLAVYAQGSGRIGIRAATLAVECPTWRFLTFVAAGSENWWVIEGWSNFSPPGK